MSTISYSTKLIFDQESDHQAIISMLEANLLAWNECSKIKFGIKENSIVKLHAAFYKDFREKYPEIKSQIVIRAEHECLSAYRSIKSNKQKIETPCVKKRLSMRLDARIFSHKNGIFSIVSLDKRIKCKPLLYTKIEELFGKYNFGDPLLFVKNNDVYICFSFEIPTLKVTSDLACGVDLGIRRVAVTSEGLFIRDKQFNSRKRSLRFLKRKLQSCGTKSAKRHLKRLRFKEKNVNKNQTHIISKKLLSQTKANTLVLEDLTKIKNKKNKYQNRNAISQVPFYQLREFLTYKAPIYGKTVIVVKPHYTSQIDHRTLKMGGVRKGCRYYGKDGIVLDADHNASVNIAHRAKLPVSYTCILDGQAFVNKPIVSLRK